MNKIFTIVLIFFTSACANIVPPAGGPKDIKAPELERSNPGQGERNVSTKKIDLIFNEEIDVQNLQNEIIITPLDEENKFSVIVRKNRLTIEFEKNLQENTTYTINFGESIIDLTEKNKANNITLAFSTGQKIDTASISGTVKNILTNQPVSNYVVALYNETDTLNPLNSKPQYFAKTNSQGQFLIRNLKEKNFHIYSFSDENKNQKWNENEKIGFHQSINPADTNNINILVFPYDNKPPSIRSTKYFYDKNEINFSEGLINYEIQNKELIPVLSDNGKILTVYKNKDYSDTLIVPMNLTDSVGLSRRDTARIYFTKKQKDEITKGLFFQVKPADLKVKRNQFETELQFNLPVLKYDLNSIKIYSDTSLKNLKQENFEWTNNTKLKVVSNIRAKDSIRLEIPKGVFTTIDSTNQERKLIYTFLQEENYATLRGTINTQTPNYILELVDTKFDVKEKRINPTSFTFDYVPAGTYYLRIIIDQNKNEKWDQGDPVKFIQPEKIIYYKNPIEVRANWEINDILFQF